MTRYIRVRAIEPQDQPWSGSVMMMKVLHKIRDVLIPENQQRPDNRREDLDRVIASASLLQISEFQFFYLAYAQWHGRDIPEKNLEYIFTDYLFGEVVPYWVRDLARKVISADAQGILDREQFNLQNRKQLSRPRYVGISYMVMVSLAVVLFCALITGQITP